MKRILSILLILTMVLGMGITSFAAKQEMNVVQITDGISQKKQNVHAVNLLMGGKDVYTDVPSVLYTIDNNSRTLVPIRFVVESLGAQIAWNQDKYEATITTQDKTIVLKINSASAVVNGKKINLPDGVPAKLLGYQGNYRTMVPLRFIAEQLGMDVGWIQETTTVTVNFSKQSITAIEYGQSNAAQQVVIKTTGTVDFTSMYLQGSKYGGNDRLVLDIPNTNLNLKDPSFEEGNGLFKKNIGTNGIMTIRASLFEPAPRNVSRIVMDLSAPKEYKIYHDKERNEIKVEFLNGASNTVKNLKTEKRNNVDAVVIQTTEPPVYNTMDLGSRVVVDILNAQLKFDKSEIPVSLGGIKKARIAEFTPDSNYNKDDKIVRVVLDLEDGQSFQNLFIDHEGNDIIVYATNTPAHGLKGFDYHKETFNKSLLHLTLNDYGKFYTEYDPFSQKLLLKVLKSKIELEATKLNIDDNMIRFIDIDGQSDSQYYYITLQLLEGTDYTLQNKDDISNEIMISFENRKIGNSKYSGKLVVIDAGHGGKDPGAQSSTLKLKEKDLALDTSLRLNKLLEEAGFSTYMTRSDDTYVGLYERSGLANGMNADVFVSMHYNATDNRSISGVQTLYVENDPVKENKTFARIVQEEMVKYLNATDRKIVDRPNLVVIRETKMPAVLTELAFLSNANEEALASTPEYRQKCAQAVFNGIKRYFDEVLLK